MSPRHPGNIRFIPVLIGFLLMLSALTLKASDEVPDYNDPSYYQETGNPAEPGEREINPDETPDESADFEEGYEEEMNPGIDSDEMEEGLEMDDDQGWQD